MRRSGGLMAALAQGGGWFGGWIRSARGAGWDRGKPLSAWPTPARWRLWVPPDLPGGRRGLPFLSPRRVPGETLGSSVVIVAILLGGVDRCRRFGVLEPSGRSRWAQRSRGFFVFVDPPLSAFVSFALSLLFLLGVTVLLPPQHLSLYDPVGCFVYKAGETLFRQSIIVGKEFFNLY